MLSGTNRKKIHELRLIAGHSRGKPRIQVRCAVFLLTLSLISSVAAPAQVQPSLSGGSLSGILSYIHSSWDSLTRSTSSCSAVVDPKLSAPPLIYLPAGLPTPSDIETMQHTCKITVAHLPEVIHHLGTPGVGSIEPPGLLYLPNKYVVPGGRFNEMYGWDSYFIILGLLRDGRIDLARGMVENFFYEIENYGAVLNANRTYYLTRSQPPFLSSMVMAVHAALKASGEDDRTWLGRAYAYIERDHAMWTQPPHLAGNTGLSRYYDFGEGPAPEALQDENDIYLQVAAYFLRHPALPNYEAEASEVPDGRASGNPYSVRVCGTERPDSTCEKYLTKLTPDYYKGDRSMRESGFDISFRFEPFGAATHHYAPVCLNSLLFKTELDLEQLARLLGKTSEAAHWQELAGKRTQAMNEYFWDQRQGLFFDYNFDDAQRSTYLYATTFYPLWAGLASPEQAQALMKNLHLFEKAGGIVTSLQQTQGQWDYPFGWAPLQLLAVEGMRRYGYNADADRISIEFLSMILQNFERDKTIREKYNVVTRSSETNVTAGYAANVIGFGWTNAAFVELLDALPGGEKSKVAEDGKGVGK
jgi:alpha,alpha-trehalase